MSGCDRILRRPAVEEEVDMKIKWESQGDGPPLLLIQGLGLRPLGLGADRAGPGRAGTG